MLAEGVGSPGGGVGRILDFTLGGTTVRVGLVGITLGSGVEVIRISCWG